MFQLWIRLIMSGLLDLDFSIIPDITQQAWDVGILVARVRFPTTIKIGNHTLVTKSIGTMLIGSLERCSFYISFPVLTYLGYFLLAKGLSNPFEIKDFLSTEVCISWVLYMFWPLNVIRWIDSWCTQMVVFIFSADLMEAGSEEDEDYDPEQDEDWKKVPRHIFIFWFARYIC